MLGHDRKSAILLLVDRKSRFVKLRKLERKTADNCNMATISALRGHICISITNDRGQEFARHEKLSKELGVPVFFCHPYTSCERGTCENRIGVLRQYFPKGADLGEVTPRQLQKIEEELNNRPMKCLGWKTPSEVVYSERVALTM